MGNRLHYRVKRTRDDIQQCKDCQGNGSMQNPARPPRLMDCATCNGQGFIAHRAPYRLADGTWSDGVDRRLPLSERAMNLGRWEVTRSDWEDAGWFAQFKEHSEMIGCHEREFPTHAEAVAYADKQARTTKNGDAS